MPLRRFLAWLDPRRRAARGAEPELVPVVALPPRPEPAPEMTCLLSVDDAGQCLLAAGTHLVLGHVRAARADLLFLADVGACHAELVRAESLRGGPSWSIAALGEERVEVGGERVSRRALRAGDVVRLAPNLAFRFALPDPSSASPLLELLGGAECAGARRIVPLAEGAGGRLRIGAAELRHVRVANLAYEIQVEKHGARLTVRCSVPGEEEPERVHELAFPPAGRVDLSCGAARGSRPPFTLSFEPAPRPFAPGAP